MTPDNIEYLVIGGYLVMLLCVGYALRKLSTDVSDYFRSGCKGTWYLVGSSAFMAAFSAWTFTGAAGVAYESGWSVTIIYAANALGFFLNFLFLAPWFRQMRAITAPEIIRKRFGVSTQQFYAGFSIVVALLHGALHLYGLALFTSAIFGFKIETIIVGIGFVVLFYSLTGGSWAVMATDFLQSLILIPLTLLVCALCLIELNGFSGLIQSIDAQGLSEDYRIFNQPGRFSANEFTIIWAVAMALKNIISNNTLTAAPRYFAVKDGREARKAALLACILMSLGIVVWIIPPMAARLLIPEHVEAISIAKPAEASYALMSLHLLPNGLVGLMVVAIFAATMSSMDTGLNRNAAIITQDVYPAICNRLGKKPNEGVARLWVGRAFTLCFGLAIIGLSLYFSGQDGKGIFEFMLDIGAMLGIPLAVPLLLCLFIRNVPPWAAIFAIVAALIPSALGYYSSELFGQKWSFQTQIFLNITVGTTAFFVTTAFWRTASNEYRQQVDHFFKQMRTPVDFQREVGAGNDDVQLRLLGRFGLAVTIFIALLLFVPNSWQGRLAILSMAGFIGIVSGAMLWAGRKTHPKKNRSSA